MKSQIIETPALSEAEGSKTRNRWTSRVPRPTHAARLSATVGVISLTLLAAAPAHAQSTAPASAPAERSIADHYRDAAVRIQGAVMAGNGSWNKMEELCDGIGHRLSGSPQLQRAVEWAAETMKKDGLANVRLEPVTVTHWVRGAESLTLLSPREHSVAMLGLGGSVATPPEGITAEVVVVRDEKDLDALGDGARGKIVLFDNPMPPYDPVGGTHYGPSVRFRSRGARLAAEKGAVACLVRSVTAHSLRSPHTGAMNYAEAKVKIPAAAISVEDAMMISRLQSRGLPVKATLRMEARTLDPAASANVIGELRGSTWPEEIVVIGGHIDSWDVGDGAHDDAGGCVQAMEAAAMLHKLNLIPRRTIRVVLFTNEENGLAGGKEYAREHAGELPRHVAAIESDGGSFAPRGYSLECADPTRERLAAGQMLDMLSLFDAWQATEVDIGGSGADLGPMRPSGLVLMHHNVDPSRYFDYHHSPADTLDKVNPEDLSRNVAVLATVAYILADMPERFGGPPTPGKIDWRKHQGAEQRAEVDRV